MKALTPMKRFQATLDNFKQAVSDVYCFGNLDKTNPKYDPYRYGVGGRSKGVESDFSIIFSPLGKKDNFTTFSFVFDYKDKAQDKHTVIVSIKPENKVPTYDSYDRTREEDEKRWALNKKIISSQVISIDVFNEQIKALTKVIRKQKLLTEVNILGFISQFFHNSAFCLEDAVSEANEKLSNSIAELTSKAKNLENDIQELRDDIRNSKKSANARYVRSKAHTDLKKAKENLLACEQAASIKEKEYLDKYDIDAKQQSLNNLRTEHQKVMQSIECVQNTFLRSQHSLVAARIGNK